MLLIVKRLIMKKNIFLLMILCNVLLLCFCAKKEIALDASKLAKNFYTEYLKADEEIGDKAEEEKTKIKQKYMTDLLIEELSLRTMQMDADSITGVQDSYGMIDSMTVNKGQDENSAIITFVFENEEGMTERVIESNVHFKKYNDKYLMNQLDMTIIFYDRDNDENTYEYTTKYANKTVLTEEDRKEMDDIKKHYEELYSEGYIG